MLFTFEISNISTGISTDHVKPIPFQPNNYNLPRYNNFRAKQPTLNTNMSDYKPTEHDGLRQDGQPDKRVGTGQFAGGKVDPVEAGKAGGHSSGGTGDSSDSTTSSGAGGGGKGQFAGGKVDPVEAGRKGGKS
ncbi:hypothetical protein EJ05DRAFT_496391 [Pseudovirgaria hyperparasitica]|uniref:Uncharacterized protein n=1 Tax=Pseudovirgaria hyperparasitica TaxID=470096 RepID=A0A6A6WN87_9PEZI|nr:uncharacterized protein EJ05DRAFT_496391 [Pseudovirgaria hyperparasitica]KAF2763578.1 hypothetical protein EJ05DRAFT_496391 [Pseudovirgaria hyperparasitica]